MNLWYTIIVAGLALALDNIVELLSDRGGNSVTPTAKERRIPGVVRAASGLVIMWFAWWVIRNGWLQSSLKVTFTSVWEGMAYGVAVAGFFRLLSGFFTSFTFLVLGPRRNVRGEINKALLGVYLFTVGGTAISVVDGVLVMVPFFIFAAFLALAVQLLPARRSEPPPSTTPKP